MSIRALIAVESCQAHRNRHQPIRDTWFKDVCVTDKRFFMGPKLDVEYEAAHEVGDEVILPINDSYEALPQKTQAICRWAIDRGFDFVFKSDTDTVFNPWTWWATDFQYHDYLGGENEDDSPYGRIQFASGGAGYWLSKRAMTIVANADNLKTNAEDVFVAHVLRESGITPVFHPGYRWRPGAIVDKDVVTLHLSSALQKKYESSQMHEYYKKMKEAL